MRTNGIRAFGLVAGLLLCSCGDDVPECKQVLSSCVDPCNISCSAGEEVACVGPDFGDYDIGENERCCICIDPNEDYGD
jgi:hypothetical protein